LGGDRGPIVEVMEFSILDKASDARPWKRVSSGGASTA